MPPEEARLDRNPAYRSIEIRSLSDVVKFTALAAILAIFTDASIGHAMMWGNDPYWTYWVTDTLLMATVFGLGTMVFGIGLGRGALITAVHVLLLTTYYWSLSPIGLPSHPEWLDLERTWITGLPIHLAVYYTGYLGAMWLWRRRAAVTVREERDPPVQSLRRLGLAALAASVGIVIGTGIIQTVLLHEFPGITWFVMRIAVAVPFTVAWWALAGTDRISAIVGGIVLGFLLITYSHFLGPIGLPSEPARFLSENSPPANVHWLSYREEFMLLLPITAAVASIAYLVAARVLGGTRSGSGPVSRTAAYGGLAAIALMVVLGVLTAPRLGSDANQVSVASVGAISGAAAGSTIANLRMTVANRNTHRTPLRPHDQIDLQATVPGASGETYEIRAAQPMVADPEGRFTTFTGVGFGEWHDGRSGIGLSDTEAAKSDVVAFALGDVRSNGRMVASGVPMQVSTTSGENKRLELHVAGLETAEGPQSLHVSWPDFRAERSDASKYGRYIFGGGALLIVLIFSFMGVLRQRPYVSG